MSLPGSPIQLVQLNVCFHTAFTSCLLREKKKHQDKSALTTAETFYSYLV